ncbi:MAG: 16S rRNA processing protein RimM [Desulfobacterales bacterium]|nr:16S rRNA processing protein RimM [Desulfobacterales bacterium]
MQAGGDHLHIGTIVGAHGVKGWVRVVSFAETSKPFTPGRRIYIKKTDGRPAAYTVRDYQPYKNILRVSFEMIATRDAAEDVVGAQLFINRSELPEPEDDSWYWHDLIGLAVYQEDTYIGRVENIFATGSNDVLVVRHEGGERLIPLIESIIRQIDLEKKTIRVDLPEGL